MKYEIKHSCGHIETVELFGKGEERERKIKWLESQPCFECQKAEANAKAEAEAKENGYPELTGTEKQVAWANTLRQQFVDSYNEKFGASNDQNFAYFLNWLIANKTEAKTWIDNRFKSVLEIGRMYFAECEASKNK